MTLTPRETDVLRLLAQGRSPKEIAADLGLAPNTVKSHIFRAHTKLGTYSVIEAFIALGWLHAPTDDELAFASLKARLTALRDEVDALLSRFRLTALRAQAGRGAVA